MQLEGLMEDIKRLGIEEEAEISRKSLKNRPQFVQDIFATEDVLGDQFNGAGRGIDSQFTHCQGEQPATESMDLYSPPPMARKMGTTSHQKST